ncbi:MAG: hypothetical protein ABSH14_04975 [Verrucomicrobiia bacterium]|jgi:hypothetical protein
MNATRALLLTALVATVVLLASGCATPKEGDVSSIPWNRPQQWEGAGGMGGFRPPGSPGY